MLITYILKDKHFVSVVYKTNLNYLYYEETNLTFHFNTNVCFC